DVSILAWDACRQVVELLLGCCRQYRASSTESDIDVSHLAILVETVDGCVQLVNMAACTLGNTARILSLGTRRGGQLIGRVRGSLRLVDAGCCPGVHVLNIASVLRVHFIQFAQPVVDGVGLLLDPHFAGERVNAAPKSLS